MTLNNTILNKKYKIEKINTKESIKKRLQDLGFIENTLIIPVYKSIFNDPVGYLIKGSIIAIRNNDSKNIIVKEWNDNNGIN